MMSPSNTRVRLLVRSDIPDVSMALTDTGINFKAAIRACFLESFCSSYSEPVSACSSFVPVHYYKINLLATN